MIEPESALMKLKLDLLILQVSFKDEYKSIGQRGVFNLNNTIGSQNTDYIDKQN